MAYVITYVTGRKELIYSLERASSGKLFFIAISANQKALFWRVPCDSRYIARIDHIQAIEPVFSKLVSITERLRYWQNQLRDASPYITVISDW